MSFDDNTTSQVNHDLSPVVNNLTANPNPSSQSPVNTDIDNAAELDITDPLLADNANARDTYRNISTTINLLQAAEASAQEINNNLTQLTDITDGQSNQIKNQEFEYQDMMAFSDNFIYGRKSALEVISEEVKHFAGLVEEASTVAQDIQNPLDSSINPNGSLATIKQEVEKFAGLIEDVSFQENLLETPMDTLNEDGKALSTIKEEIKKFAGIVDCLEASIDMFKDIENSYETQAESNMPDDSVISDIEEASALAVATATKIHVDPYADQAHTDSIMAVAPILLD